MSRRLPSVVYLIYDTIRYGARAARAEWLSASRNQREAAAQGIYIGWSKGDEFKRLYLLYKQRLLVRRWHAGVDTWYKRAWLRCKRGHTRRPSARCSRACYLSLVVLYLAMAVGAAWAQRRTQPRRRRCGCCGHSHGWPLELR